MNDLHAPTMDAPPRDPEHEPSLEGLEARLETWLQALKTTGRASDAPGSDATEEVRSHLEETLGSPADEVVSFSVGSAPSEALTELHAKLVAAIVCATAGLNPVVPRDAIDSCKNEFKPLDLAPSGQPPTSAQLANFCVRQMAVAHQQGKVDPLSMGLLMFVFSHASDARFNVFVRILSMSIQSQLDKEANWSGCHPTAQQSYLKAAEEWIQKSGAPATSDAILAGAKELALAGTVAARLTQPRARLDSMRGLAYNVFVQKVLGGSTEQLSALMVAMNGVIQVFGFVGGEYLGLLQG